MLPSIEKHHLLYLLPFLSTLSSQHIFFLNDLFSFWNLPILYPRNVHPFWQVCNFLTFISEDTKTNLIKSLWLFYPSILLTVLVWRTVLWRRNNFGQLVKGYQWRQSGREKYGTPWMPRLEMFGIYSFCPSRVLLMPLDSRGRWDGAASLYGLRSTPTNWKVPPGLGRVEV